MSDQARSALEKDIEKMQRDIQFAQQDAQSEVTDLTNELQNDFQVKLNPIIEQLRVEKGLQMIFDVRDSGIVAADTGWICPPKSSSASTPPPKTAPKK